MRGWFNIHKSINVIHHANRPKDKNHMIISLNAEKVFDQIQDLFMTEVLARPSVQGTCLNRKKLIYSMTTANINLDGEKFKSFPLKP